MARPSLLAASLYKRILARIQYFSPSSKPAAMGEKEESGDLGDLQEAESAEQKGRIFADNSFLT